MAPYLWLKVIVDILVEESHVDQQTDSDECVVETIVEISVY